MVSDDLWQVTTKGAKWIFQGFIYISTVYMKLRFKENMAVWRQLPNLFNWDVQIGFDPKIHLEN